MNNLIYFNKNPLNGYLFIIETLLIENLLVYVKSTEDILCIVF